MIRVVSRSPEINWDIGESEGRIVVNLRIATDSGTFVSVRPVKEVGVPEELSELRRQLEYYRKNAGVVSSPAGFIASAQARKKSVYQELISSGVPATPVVLRHVDLRIQAPNRYALYKGTVWMTASDFTLAGWIEFADRAIQDPEGTAFGRFFGQDRLKSALRERIQRARKSGAALPHMMIDAPTEMGKSTLAQVVADALDVEFSAIPSEQLLDANNLIALLSKIRVHQVLYLEDIENLRRPLWDLLIGAITKVEVPLQVGVGPRARSQLLPMPEFTVIGGTGRLWRVDERLRRWFVPYEFDPYTPADMAAIFASLAEEQGYGIAKDVVGTLARHCKGNPGNALVLAQRLATQCADLVKPQLTVSKAPEALARLGFDQNYPLSLRLVDQIASMSGIEFEQWVANLFRSSGWETAQTAATGDHGIDLIINKDGSRSVVQCKRWLDPVGEPVVRDFYGALMSFGARRGFVIAPTTFTDQAQRFIVGKPIVLIGIDELMEWNKSPGTYRLGE